MPNRNRNHASNSSRLGRSLVLPYIRESQDESVSCREAAGVLTMFARHIGLLIGLLWLPLMDAGGAALPAPIKKFLLGL